MRINTNSICGVTLATVIDGRETQASRNAFTSMMRFTATLSMAVGRPCSSKGVLKLNGIPSVKAVWTSPEGFGDIGVECDTMIVSTKR
jgi:hypothetical protein